VAQLFKTAGTLERFERFKTGESVETLMAEAETARAGRLSNNKTAK
jgi:hypothetical protein